MKIRVLLLFMAAFAAGQLPHDETGDTYSGYVYYPENGIAYTVCADSWDDADARVACYELDPKYTEGLAYTHYLEPGTTGHRFWMSEFQCTGYEHGLVYCPHTYLAHDDDCKSGHHAGVLCFSKGAAGIAYRMNGDNRASGRVEVYINDDWGSICQDDGWNNNAARVFCRSSGFLDGQVENIPDGIPLHHGAVYSIKLNCSGDESELNKCPHQGWVPMVYSTCSHEVAVTCFGNVRLHDGEAITGMKSGALEVYHKKQWVAVCDSGFSDLEASVVCRELDPDLPYAKAIKESAFGNKTHVPIITSISCTGTEGSIDFCAISDTDTCSSGHYASVACSKTPFDTAEGNATSYNTIDTYSGYIAMYGNDSVYTICADGWDDSDALVACRFIGYNAGIGYHHYLEPDTEGHIFLTSKFECTGHEQVLSECPHRYISEDLPCSSGRHAGVLCWNKGGMAYRMAGNERASGRVEVYINDDWGSMCHDDGWDTNAARVFCRSSGFHDGRPTSITEDHSGLLWGVYFKCSGTESDLNQCELKGWQPMEKFSCFHDAGVICYGNVKLLNGERNPEMESGAVQVYHQGSWLEVCDSGLSELEASIICKEVNPSLPYAEVLTGSAFGTLKHAPAKITSINCTGVESSISHCAISDLEKCPSGHYASVICSKTPFEEEKRELVRLDGGVETKDMQTGSVQVYHHGQWTSVCDSHFTLQEAEVVCQEINQNLPFAMVVKGSVFSPMSQTPINITAVRCSGVEDSLTRCAITDTGSCPSGNYVSVVCSLDSLTEREEEAEEQVVLHHRDSPYTGTIGIYRPHKTGFVCGDSWDDEDAKVACRQLQNGYTDGIAYRHHGHDHSDTIPYIATMYNCKGDEDRLSQCPHIDVTGDIQCKSGHHAGVLCLKDTGVFYQTEGHDRASGNVNVYFDGKRGGLCHDEGWDDNAARVFCRSSGFLDGEVRYHYEGIDAPPSTFFSPHFECTGSENELNTCPHLGWTSTNESSCSRAAVTCFGNGIAYRMTGNETATGPVEVYINGGWGSLCHDDGWNNKAAQVFCRASGFRGGYTARLPEGNSSHSGPMWSTKFRCSGGESELNKCPQKGWTLIDRSKCSHEAAVDCTHEANVGGLEGTGTEDSAPVNIIIIASAVVAGLLVLAAVAVVLYKNNIITSLRLRRLFRRRALGDDDALQARHSVETGAVSVAVENMQSNSL